MVHRPWLLTATANEITGSELELKTRCVQLRSRNCFMDEAALHELLSGRRRDLGAKALRAGLHLASWSYCGAINLRNAAYDRNWLAITQVDASVISLGNITTGGTGKTPMAAWLANWLLNKGHKPGLLSRGYRSIHTASGNASDHGNDEKLVLDRLCPGVPHLQQRDRVSAATRLLSEHDCNTLILDDGFQHRRLQRDLDLMLVDALQPWGFGHVLPRGLLREPLSGLRRADLILLTRADQVSTIQRREVLQTVVSICGPVDCIEVAFAPRRLIGLQGDTLSIDAAHGINGFAFCGIGNPDGFARTVCSLTQTSTINLAKRLRVFPDHHHYDERDMTSIADNAHAVHADIVLTTLKDLVKIRPEIWQGPPLYAVEVGVEFLSGQDLLETRLHRLRSRLQRAA